MKQIPAPWLRQLRNQIPITDLIVQLQLPMLCQGGLLRFCCPLCHQYQTATNPITNLGRCFHCQKNFNPIDLVMAVHEYSFLDALKFLEESALPDRRIPALLRRR